MAEKNRVLKYLKTKTQMAIGKWKCWRVCGLNWLIIVNPRAEWCSRKS